MIPVIAVLATHIFSERPNLDAFEEGVLLAKRIRANDFARVIASDSGTAEIVGLDKVFEKDRIAIGWWNEGFRKVPVEFVTELSETALSRAVGYLSVRDLWKDSDVERAWSQVKAKGDGKRAWIVALSAFPTKTKFGLGDDLTPELDELVNIKFALDGSMGRVEPHARLVHERRAKSKVELDGVPWWEFSPFAQPLKFEMAKPYEVPLIERGDYYRVWWLVWTDCELGKGTTSLKIASRRKVREAIFD